MNKIIFTLLVLLAAIHVKSEILISTVAQVKNHVITSREVEIHKLIMPYLKINLDEDEAAGVEERVIREWILFFEASAFYSNSIDDQTVKQEVDRLKARVQGNAQWQRLSVSDKELSVKMKRRFEADRLFDFKKKASVLPVPPAEIEGEYNQNRIRYGNKSFSEVKLEIRERMVQQNLANRMQQWFLALEKKYNVQRFLKHEKDSDK